MLKISYFTPRFYPAISGGEFYILSLAETLKKIHKYDVEIICSDAIDFKALKDIKGLRIDSSNPNFREYRRIPITRLNLDYQYLTSDEKFSKAVDNCMKLIKLCKLPFNRQLVKTFLENGLNFTYYVQDVIDGNIEFDADIIHSTFLPYSSLLYSLILAKIKKIPAVCTPFYHIFNPRYDSIHYLEILMQFDLILACTSAERDFIIKKGVSPEKIDVIPMGVDFTLYNSPVKSKSGKLKSFTNQFNFKNPFVLYCGYKNYEKGSLSLLKAARKVYSVDPSIKYVFIGPTTPAFDYELKKSRNMGIEILNLTPDSMKGFFDWRKISAFQECDVFAMPSRSDAYGIVYLEAWAAQKPVIGARNPVMEQVIEDGKTGILVEFDDVESISKAILKLIKNKPLSHKMGLNGMKKVKSNNTWLKISSETKKIYEKLV